MQQDTWSVHWGCGLAYYIEDRTEIFALVEQLQRSSAAAVTAGTWNRDTRASVGMRYRFLGALGAPGLAEPQRLLH